MELYTADGDNVLDMLQSESNGDLEGVSLAALPHLSSSVCENKTVCTVCVLCVYFVHCVFCVDRVYCVYCVCAYFVHCVCCVCCVYCVCVLCTTQLTTSASVFDLCIRTTSLQRPLHRLLQGHKHTSV